MHQKARLYVSKLNYEKIKGVTQEEKENLVLFQGWLMEGFRNSDSSSPEGQSIHSCWDNILSANLSLVLGQSYNQNCKESDTTKCTHTHHTQTNSSSVGMVF